MPLKIDVRAFLSRCLGRWARRLAPAAADRSGAAPVDTPAGRDENRDMGVIGIPLPVKLIVGMLARQADRLEQARRRLEEAFGPVDLASEPMDFDATDYYEREMGRPLVRQFLAFERLIRPEELAAIKLRTNQMEMELVGQTTTTPMSTSPTGETPRAASLPGVLRPRVVNIDPGYVTPGKLVLASTRGFAHRVYLGQGIFAEVTLMFMHGRWVSHACTFPDYASGRYDAFLGRVRDRLKQQQREAPP